MDDSDEEGLDFSGRDDGKEETASRTWYLNDKLTNKLKSTLRFPVGGHVGVPDRELYSPLRDLPLSLIHI